MKMIIELETLSKSDVIHAYVAITGLMRVLDLEPEPKDEKNLKIAEPFPGGGDKVRKI